MRWGTLKPAACHQALVSAVAACARRGLSPVSYSCGGPSQHGVTSDCSAVSWLSLIRLETARSAFTFEIGSHVAQADLQLFIRLSHCPECWDYMRASASPTLHE